MIERQHLLARAVILRSEPTGIAVLLAQQIGENHTFLPGGHVDLGEGLVQSLRRELREELDVECRVVRYLGAVEHQWPDDNPRHYEVSHVFLTELAEPLADPISRESHLRFSWCPIDALAEHNLQATPLRQLIPAYVSGVQRGWWATTLSEGNLNVEGDGS